MTERRTRGHTVRPRDMPGAEGGAGRSRPGEEEPVPGLSDRVVYQWDDASAAAVTCRQGKSANERNLCASRGSTGAVALVKGRRPARWDGQEDDRDDQSRENRHQQSGGDDLIGRRTHPPKDKPGRDVNRSLRRLPREASVTRS